MNSHGLETLGSGIGASTLSASPLAFEGEQIPIITEIDNHFVGQITKRIP